MSSLSKPIPPKQRDLKPKDAPSSAAQSPTASSFDHQLLGIPLFQNSLWERTVAKILPATTGLFRKKPPRFESGVVDRLTLWERFLVHRSRRNRKMSLRVTYKHTMVSCERFQKLALCEIVQQILDHQHGWENQPLNVVVNDKPLRQCLDPRMKTGDELAVAVIDDTGKLQTCTVNLKHAAELSRAELTDYIETVLSQRCESSDPVSVVLDCGASTIAFNRATYANYPGAWLHLTIDHSVGGIVATADHLVIDGNLFQQIILNASRELATDRRPHLPQQLQLTRQLRVDNVSSMSSLLNLLTQALNDSGLRLNTGQQSVMLATIDDAGPDVPQQISKYQRRIQPLIMCMKDALTSEEIKRRVAHLNGNGWNSLGTQVWKQLYSGTVPKWLLFYMERMAPHVPCQHASSFLSGSVLVSFLPKFQHPGLCSSDLASVTMQTIPPPGGGPVITVIQTEDRQTGGNTAFITLDGNGKWGKPQKIAELRTHLEARLQTESKAEPQPPALRA